MILLFFSLSTFANGLVIDEFFYQEQLSKWYALDAHLSVQYFNQNKSLEEVQQQTKGWQNWENATLGTERNTRLWLKLELKNTLKEELELVFLLHSADMSFWYQNTKSIGGHKRPRSEWDSQQHQPIYSSPHTIQFSVPAASTPTIFVQLHSRESWGGLHPQLCNRAFFLAHSNTYFNRTIATQSLFHGMLWMMLLFHLVMYFLNREPAYFYFSAYIFFLSIFLFYNFEFHFLTPLAEFPSWNQVLSVGSLCGFTLTYAAFLRSFLHENWRSDLASHLTTFVQLNLGFGLMLTLLGVFNIEDKLIIWLLFPISIFNLLALVWITWKYGQSDNQLARFIAVCNACMMLGLLVSASIFYGGSLNWFNLRISAFWGILFLEASLILQLLSFGLGLSYKSLLVERQRLELQELDALKSKFFANISHEFRTPLTLILSPLKQLKAMVNHERSRQQLRIAEHYAQRLLQMVNQILDLSKIEAGKMKLERTNFDMVQVCKIIAQSFESVAQERDIKIEVQCVQEVLFVAMDREKMEQVLINLIGNAVKYNKEAGTVQIRVGTKKQQLEIEVADTGHGIENEELPYIFQMYYEGKKNEETVKQATTGIGLALTKELVVLHGGEISVDSKLNQGTTFIVRLPLVKASVELSNESISSANILMPPLSEPEQVSTESEQAIVLVIDDHQDIRNYIQSCLADEYKVLTASDGEKGLKVAQEEVPDLIITDRMMPKMDGIQLTKNLKKHTVTSHIPIIMLTGKSSQESRLEGLQTQVDDYLTKPFDVVELKIRLKNLLENRKKWVSNFEQQNEGVRKRAVPKSLEEQFLEKLTTIIQENLSDENFGVEQLGRAIHLDRTQLFRKLKALTGQNPSQFIRVLRLNAAHKLLQSQSASIAEVAFQVGFSNPSYFSRTFKAHFGKTPGAIGKSEK